MGEERAEVEWGGEISLFIYFGKRKLELQKGSLLRKRNSIESLSVQTNNEKQYRPMASWRNHALPLKTHKSEIKRASKTPTWRSDLDILIRHGSDFYQRCHLVFGLNHCRPNKWGSPSATSGLAGPRTTHLKSLTLKEQGEGIVSVCVCPCMLCGDIFVFTAWI